MNPLSEQKVGVKAPAVMGAIGGLVLLFLVSVASRVKLPSSSRGVRTPFSWTQSWLIQFYSGLSLDH